MRRWRLYAAVVPWIGSSSSEVDGSDADADADDVVESARWIETMGAEDRLAIDAVLLSKKSEEVRKRPIRLVDLMWLARLIEVDADSEDRSE